MEAQSDLTHHFSPTAAVKNGFFCISLHHSATAAFRNVELLSQKKIKNGFEGRRGMMMRMTVSSK